jgi:hypothetical protein
MIAIAGIAKQADSATHVHSTGEAGRHPVVNTASKGKGACGSPWRTDERTPFAGASRRYLIGGAVAPRSWVWASR